MSGSLTKQAYILLKSTQPIKPKAHSKIKVCTLLCMYLLVATAVLKPLWCKKNVHFIIWFGWIFGWTNSDRILGFCYQICLPINISKIWPKLPQKLSNFLKIVIYLYVNTISKKVEQLKNCWHVLNSKNTHVCDIHHFEGWNFLVNFLAKKKNFTHRNKQVCTWG